MSTSVGRECTAAYLYRAADKTGDTVDFLLTAKRDAAAALRFLRRAIKSNGAPVKVNIDCSGANAGNSARPT